MTSAALPEGVLPALVKVRTTACFASSATCGITVGSEHRGTLLISVLMMMIRRITYVMVLIRKS